MIRIINKTWHTVTNAGLNGSRGWRTLRCVRGASVTIGSRQRRVDGVETQKMLTYEEQELNRQDRLNEVGTLPPCPFCGRLRVQRSDYIRCNVCGTNWLDGEDVSRNPKIERYNKMVAEQRKSAQPNLAEQRAIG